MKKYLIAFLLAAVLLAVQEVLAHKCRAALWGGVLPALALLGTAAVFALGLLPLLPQFVLPAAAVNTVLVWSWACGIGKRRRTFSGDVPAEAAAGKN